MSESTSTSSRLPHFRSKRRGGRGDDVMSATSETSPDNGVMVMLDELVDLDMAEAVLRHRAEIEEAVGRRSVAFCPLTDDDDVIVEGETSGAMSVRRLAVIDWKALRTTVDVATALGGRLPVQYYKDESAEGFGRMKSRVKVTMKSDDVEGGGGMRCVPYVYMMREARAAMAAKYYWDVDFANCQPSILRQRLEKAEIACPLLARYVDGRDACLADVRAACGVGRDDAKALFLRIVFGGRVSGWERDLACRGIKLSSRPPAWVVELGDEVARCSALLVALDDMVDLRTHHTRSSSAVRVPARRVIASQLAVHLQTIEADCVRALHRAVTGSRRRVGGIIFDGVHVERLPGDDAVAGGIDVSVLDKWSDQVMAETGYRLKLTVKPFDVLPCLQDGADVAAAAAEDVNWMANDRLLTYAATKTCWEGRVFKAIRSGNYCVEEPGGNRTMYSERGLHDSYRHIQYVTTSVSTDTGGHELRFHPFVNRWVTDRSIRMFHEVVLRPPPLASEMGARGASGDVYNIWTPFAAAERPEGFDEYDAAGAVVAFESFMSTLFASAVVTKYVIDWLAQMFQQPATKSRVALLFKGEEGVGKNRWTDLVRLMVGTSKFLQTANPASSLYGRFTRLREGKIFIVINEVNGADSFSKNDIIKDMITNDDFISEGKNTNSYPMACFARFCFTTNNFNSVRVTADGRRFVVVEVSSALKGNTAYFKKLSGLIDDPRARHAYYLSLMSRDISGVDWVNDRPLTEYYTTMVQQSISPEYRYLRTVLVDAHLAGTRALRQGAAVLFEGFKKWLVASSSTDRASYEISLEKFGQRLSELLVKAVPRASPEDSAPSESSVDVADDAGFSEAAPSARVNALRGISKQRTNKGFVYAFDMPVVVREMLRVRWITLDDLPPGDFAMFPLISD